MTRVLGGTITDWILGLTLHQPWASAVTMGLKKIETREWGTNYRGLIAIHAGKTVPDEEARARMAAALAAADHPAADALALGHLPMGEVVAVVQLVDCVPMTPEWIAQVDPLEREFGGYEPGRWGWILDKLRIVGGARAGVQLKGRQQLFRLTKAEAASVRAGIAEWNEASDA